jgi:hypothetical protein
MITFFQRGGAKRAGGVALQKIMRGDGMEIGEPTVG